MKNEREHTIGDMNHGEPSQRICQKFTWTC